MLDRLDAEAARLDASRSYAARRLIAAGLAGEPTPAAPSDHAVHDRPDAQR